MPHLEGVDVDAFENRLGSALADDMEHGAGADVIRGVLFTNADRKSTLVSDESAFYKKTGKQFAAHETVNHSAKEYARGDVTTNSVEGFFGIFKRGMRGNYQHCAEKNLHRYLAEFDFRYNTKSITDGERAVLAVKGGEGKRLTYRQPH